MAEIDPRRVSPVSRPLARRLWRVLPGLGVLLLLSLLGAAGLGYVAISYPDLFRSLWAHLRGAPSGLPQGVEQTLWSLRLPRIILGATVGAALSIAGASLQGLLLNPLADPYLIGVSAGAAFGATLAIFLGLGEAAGGLYRILIAFAAALLTLLMVYRLALKRGRIGREAFILAGVVVGSFLWALVTLIMALARGGQLTNLISWLLGDFTLVSSWASSGLALLLVAAAGLALYAFARDLNLLALGEESAAQLGVEVERLKKVVILLAALLTAAAVAVSGVIGFVGLIIPHIVRRLWGPDHRLLLPASALLGAVFLVGADALARTALPPSELPVGVITSLLGAPFFCYLLVFSRRSEPSP
jgi:iron complex transport system permease protein